MFKYSAYIKIVKSSAYCNYYQISHSNLYFAYTVYYNYVLYMGLRTLFFSTA